MKRDRQRLGMLFLFFLLMVFGPSGGTEAQVSPNYTIEDSVMPGGGSDGSSPGYDLWSVMGQSSALGISSSSHYVNQGGFWPLLGDRVKIYYLLSKYYQDILRRGPDAGGVAGWIGEMDRVVLLEIDIIEGFIAVGKSFFNSNEYLGLGKTNTEYVMDLYQAFLGRTPAPGEITFHLDYMAQGVSRNEVLNNFIFSLEYKGYVEGFFGVRGVRPENTLVDDFYRGILSRLPETVGFEYWLGQMRGAQCAESEEQIRDLSYEIALGFIQSDEYLGKGRTDGQFVEDLYDAILRRGAAPWEVSYWLGLLGTGTRAEVLEGFTGSNEFQDRVDAVIAAGCLP